MSTELSDSRSTYIIICSGDTEMLAAEPIKEKVRIAAQCARDMCMYLGIMANDDLTVADTKPLSDNMHATQALMRETPVNQRAVLAKVEELMALLRALDRKFSKY